LVVLQIESVVEDELFPGLDIPDGPDPDTSPFVVGFAVGITTVIDKPQNPVLSWYINMSTFKFESCRKLD